MQNIIICHNFNNFSYAANSVKIACSLAECGYQVTFITHDEATSKESHPNLCVLKWPEKRPVGLPSLLFIVKQIKRTKCCLIIGHAAAFNIVAIGAWIMKVRVRIGYYHSVYNSTIIDNGESPFLVWIKKIRKTLFVHCYNHLICVSNFAASDIQSVFKVPSNRCTVIHNGIPDRQPNILQFDKPTNPPLRFFLPTRLDPGKNTLDVIEGFLKFINESGILAELQIAGDGLLKSQILEYSKANACIKFVGLLPYHQIDQNMQNAHFVVCATLAEAFGMVNIEGFMNGTPVIANNVGGIPEIITDGQTGMLVSGHNVTDWKRAFERASNLWESNPLEYEKMRISGRNNFLQNFTAEKKVKQTVQFITHLLGNVK